MDLFARKWLVWELLVVDPIGWEIRRRLMLDANVAALGYIA